MRRLTSISALAAIATLALAPSALAAKPVVLDLPPIIYDDPFVCGGDPVVHVEYTATLRLALTFDGDGNLLRDVIRPAGPVIVTFSVDGSDRTLSGMSPAPFRTIYNPDGSVATLTGNGLNVAITLPGQGVVLHDAGSITWTGGFGGALEGSAGHHDWYLAGDTQAFCDYLSA